MASFFVHNQLSNGGGAYVSSDLFVTVAGTVRAPNGAGIIRTVSAFNDGDFTRQLGQSDSTLPFGNFSFQVPGIDTTKITVIARSEGQENSVIYARCSVVGGGAGYTPPPIDNIPFYVGNGETTAPYCDIYHPMSSIEAEAVNQIVVTANFGLMSGIESEAVNANVVNGEINHPMSSLSAVAVSFRLAYGNIAPSMSRIEAVAVNANVVDCTINHPMSRIEAETGSDCTINHPMSRVEAVAVNPSAADCNINHEMSRINSELQTIRITSLSLVSPGAIMSLAGSSEGQGSFELTAPGAMFSFDGDQSIDNEMSFIAPGAMFSLSGNQTAKYGVVRNIRGEIR